MISENLRKCLLERLPDKPYCSTNSKHGVRILPKRLASRYPYLQLNPPWTVSFLVLDVDREGAAFAWEDRLPVPSYVCVSPHNAHAQLLYELEDPVLFGPNASLKPQAWLADIKRLFTHAIDADRDYAGNLAKNPLHRNWRVIASGKAYELSQLSEHARLIRAEMSAKDRSGVFYRSARSSLDPYRSRNCRLFDAVRMRGYNVVSSFEDQESLRRYLHDFAQEKNRFLPPLPESEVRSISRSTSRWIYRRKAFFSHRRCRERVVDAEDLRERQQAAARRTNRIRSETVAARVEQAIAESPAPLGKKSLARRAGVSLSHVKRNWDRYREGASRCHSQGSSAAAGGGAPLIKRRGGRRSNDGMAAPRRRVPRREKELQVSPPSPPRPPRRVRPGAAMLAARRRARRAAAARWTRTAGTFRQRQQRRRLARRKNLRFALSVQKELRRSLPRLE